MRASPGARPLLGSGRGRSRSGNHPGDGGCRRFEGVRRSTHLILNPILRRCKFNNPNRDSHTCHVSALKSAMSMNWGTGHERRSLAQSVHITGVFEVDTRGVASREVASVSFWGMRTGPAREDDTFERCLGRPWRSPCRSSKAGLRERPPSGERKTITAQKVTQAGTFGLTRRVI
jgi:hypothetical protein